MSRAKFEVVFDGEALASHRMDVRDLAPALLALGDSIRRANQNLNGDRATVNVYVDSEFEHGCFVVSLEVIQDLMDAARTLLQDDYVQTAKEILTWLGIVGSLSGFGVIGFLKYRRGRQITESPKRRTQILAALFALKLLATRTMLQYINTSMR